MKTRDNSAIFCAFCSLVHALKAGFEATVWAMLSTVDLNSGLFKSAFTV